MVYFSTILSLAATAVSFSGFAAAHPHHAPGSPEFLKRAIFQNNARRSLADCQSELRKRGGVYEKARARREKNAHKLREARGLKSGPFKRDLDTVLATDHKSNLTGVTNNTDASTLFEGNSSCVLAPEVTRGPYYVDGEFVRWDIRDEQEGVDMYVDIQLIDVSTCEPVPNVYVDFWHANATGVYAGVIASGNGDSSDLTNLDNTFLRGLQQTDADGVAQWLSIFPGHYTGRATHIHILAHQDGTVFDNGTFVGTTARHVGQTFFDQDLITSIDATSPYSTNSQELTTNSDDSILAEQASDIDPVLEYVLLGDSIDQGLMMWSAIGIDSSAAYSVSAAATLTEDGGVENENAGGMGGGGGQGGPPSDADAASSSGTASSTSSGSETTESSSASDILPLGGLFTHLSFYAMLGLLWL